jgi:hypothetical protein
MRKVIIRVSLYLHTFYVSAENCILKNLKWPVFFSILASAGIIFLPWLQVSADKADNSEKIIEGVVFDDISPVSGALVRIQTTEHSTLTGADGKFILLIPESLKSPVKLTAWAKGYYISGPAEALPGEKNLKISLHRHGRWDNREYKWLPSRRSNGSGEDQGCSECHLRGDAAPGYALPVDEWLQDAHSQSAVNPLFLAMHSGKDISDRRSPSTRYRYTEDNKLFQLPPDPKETYYGPGYSLDNPNNPGNCGACHIPLAAVKAPLNVRPEWIKGVEAEGINCDFCHKIYGVHLDPVSGLPSPDKPGVLSYEFRRPFEGHQFFAGPLDDIAPGEDTYSGLQKASQFCAPCHYGVFEGTVVYDSFGEWLRSPYSSGDSGKTCQDCHMPGTGAEFFAHPEKGGLKRNADNVVSHRMPGARDLDLLQNAVSFTLKAEQQPEGIRVKTKVVNDLTGHHVPTDSPLRHLILVVRAYGSDTSELSLKEGPSLPEWCSSGDPKEGNYAGLPGKVYIKLLEEKWTGISPTAAYWRPTRVVMDTRLGAFEADNGEFLFKAPDSGDVRVEALLIYRRAFKKLMEQKGLIEPDIVMESATVLLSQK